MLFVFSSIVEVIVKFFSETKRNSRGKRALLLIVRYNIVGQIWHILV